MKGKAIIFFATKDELIDIIEEAFLDIDFKLYRIDDIQNNEAEVYQSIEEVPDIGISIAGNHVLDKRYLLIPSNQEMAIESIALKKGGFNYNADQGNNPDSVLFEPGGVYKDYEAIISGQISTISESEWSLKLFNNLSSKIKKKFTPIKSYYVSKNAEVKLDEGIRLTAAVNRPTLYDLKKEENN
ncbi:hypothetical protein PGH07_08395 [Sulfurovum sp. zt1-1]|uniref:Uncharacterized protein n=1 Tax=Sulfurovum zhangzhouensis TaxID=3019067 RepID=A0ABT7QZG3_9BACT|nr:hypothetical protein [Sulfurovum zhangzhouensis]MDM5272198.1 hypothetical protein [Sulfurovum zhangzhouensis]